MGNAQRRAADAEKALQELVGRHASETATLTRRNAELEEQAVAYQNLVDELGGELHLELDTAEKRVADLKNRIARLS